LSFPSARSTRRWNSAKCSEPWEEAQQLVPKPKLLVFAAFQFDPEAAKDIDEMKPELAGMQFFKVQMNADLLTDDLKKKRASNESFWLIGQPDVHIGAHRQGRGQGQVHASRCTASTTTTPRPAASNPAARTRSPSGCSTPTTTGAASTRARSSSRWPARNEGWAKLARNLKAEIDEDLIEAYRGTVSLPFEPGEHKRIAVKIVDDRGIESLKVLEVE
jgi:adenine-specific DNA-methyltransferase